MLPAAWESSRQVADTKHRQLLPSSQLGHPGERELPLDQDQPLLLPVGHLTGQEFPTAPADRKLSQPWR